MTDLTPRQRQVLEFIDAEVRRPRLPARASGRSARPSASPRAPPSTPTSPRCRTRATSRRDPTKPRAIEISLDAESGAAVERRPVRHVPLVGDVAAGTGVLAAENIEETLPMPEDFTGDGSSSCSGSAATR